VKTIAAAAGYEVTVAEEAERLRPAGSEVMRLVCDSSRLTAATGWKPTVSLAEGLAQDRRVVLAAGEPGALQVERVHGMSAR